jgi:hypothetical protein
MTKFIPDLLPDLGSLDAHVFSSPIASGRLF